MIVTKVHTRPYAGNPGRYPSVAKFHKDWRVVAGKPIGVAASIWQNNSKHDNQGPPDQPLDNLEMPKSQCYL
jgi:hypothetical protein